MLKKNLLAILFLTLGLLVSTTMEAGELKKKKKVDKKETTKGKPTTTPPATAKTPTNEPKSYAEVITDDTKTSDSFLKVHYTKGKYYFELPDSIFSRDILVVNRISNAPANPYKMTVGYPGDKIGDNVIRFEKGPENKILLRSVSYIEQSKDTLGMYQSVKNSNVQPIEAAFSIEAFGKDSANNATCVIDMTNYISGDNSILFFDTYLKKAKGIGAYNKDRSYIDTLKAFPINIEIKTVKTYTQALPKGFPPARADYYPSGPLTYELNSSMVLLPKEPMKPRFFDARVGYFAVQYIDFDSNPQGVDYKAMITRWRLEPKEEDMEKWKKGELVEPKKPIVFYIDPATPRKWVPYLIAGVNDWQIAFEQAGFKNAIYGLEAPNDPEWSLEDARHSAIVYKPSNIPNASGPHIHDPRSGEILETHINWYHNVMSLLRNWYMIQAGAIDPGARTVNMEDELMGELIRFVSSHEVGHTLGLRHNFGSSNTVSVENLRNKEWVEANGHTPSIMDYARFNYIAQPEDNISRAGIFPRIGLYDKWAIEWGYTYLPQFATTEAEDTYLNQWIIGKLEADIRHTFGTERDIDDPRNQNEDLGDNAMKASAYGIKNLQRILPNILDWTKEPNKGYSAANTIYGEVVGQYGRYMGHVAKNVGGIYSTPRAVEEKGNSKEYVPASTQREAMTFINTQLFATPTWLVDKQLIEKAGVDPIKSIGDIQKRTLDRLISKYTIDKMSKDEAYNGNKAYTAANMFSDLKKGIWSELYNAKSVDIYRRNLQKNYVNALIAIVKINPSSSASSNMAPGRTVVELKASASDATSIARAELTGLRRDIKVAANTATGLKRYHLQDMAAQIDVALDTSK